MGCTRPVAVKGQGGVGKTKYIFSPLFFLLHRSSFRAGCVINCTGQRGIYVQVQMEVTSDLSCGVSQLSNCHTMDCLDNEPRLFVLISSYLMLFPKCGHLLTERPQACVSAHVFFFFSFLICFSLSAQMSTVFCTKPSKVFWIPPGTTEVIGQLVTQSADNVCFMLLPECGELFAVADELRSASEARWKWSGP